LGVDERDHGFVSDSRLETVGQVYLGVQPEFPFVAFSVDKRPDEPLMTASTRRRSFRRQWPIDRVPRLPPLYPNAGERKGGWRARSSRASLTQSDVGASSGLAHRSGTCAVVVEKNRDRLHVCHVVMNRDDVQAVRTQRLEDGVTSGSSIATSPATIASASVPANAAHVFRPIRALIGAPCSRKSMSGRPIVIL
jgi:hypothetical protein